MKHLMNFNKRKVALSLMAALAWGGVSSAWADNADFENALPEDWEAVGTMTYYERPKTGSYSIGNSEGSGWDTNRGNYIKTTMLEGDISLWLRSYKDRTTGYVVLFKLSDDGETVGDKLVAFSSSSATFAEKTYTLSEPTRLAIVINYAHLDNMTYTPYVQTDGPALTVKDGTKKLSSPYAFDFGLATAGTTKTLTLSNPGTKAVEGLAVSANDFNATLSATTIAAGGEATLTITMPETTASNTFTLSSTTTGIEPFVFNISGTVKDPNKVYLDFADGQMPDGWTSVKIGSYASDWTVSTGYAGVSGYGSSYEAAFTSPKMNFQEGETIFFKTSKNGSSSLTTPTFKVQYSIDGNTWTTIGSEYTDDVYGTWTQRSVTIPTAEAKYIRFSGWYFRLTEFYGGELPNEPKMVVTQPESLDFGVITEATTKTFTIANTGKATLEGINVVSSNEAFTVIGAPTSLASGASQEVTVTMSAANAGALSSNITVSATGMEDVTFTLTGAVMPEGAFVVDFNDNALPAGWENASWTFANGAATGKSSSAYLTTPSLVFSEGDIIVIKAKRADNDATDYITIQGSSDNGATWTAYSKKITGSDGLSYPDYGSLVLTDIPTTVNKLRFVGYYVVVDEIVGLTYNENAPVISVTPAENAAFGKVTATPEAKTYTVANTGTGKMTVNITSSSEDFTVSPATIENIENGAPQTFTVTFNYNVESLGDKEADITVTPTYDETAAVSFKATAQVKNPNVWDEDFEDGSIPSVWVNEGSWTVTTPTASGNNGTKMAYISSYNNPKSLITPRLEAKANESLTFYIGMQYDDEPLTIEYSNDEKASWNVIESGVDSYTASGDITFTAPADGYYYLRFTGTYAMLDNFNGFKLALKEHDAIIKAQNVPATGTQYVEYTASVTVEEMAGKAEELTAKFFIGTTKYGEDVTETVEANGTKTFTVTFTTEEPVSGDAYFTVSNAGINLESAKTAVKIAAATVIDENATNEFAEGRLAAVVLNYTKVAGKWGTIALPFQTTAADLATAFGVSEIKAFGYKSSAENSMTFQPATPKMYAGYVYVIYSDEALNGAKFFDVQVTAPTAMSDGESTKLQATYAPVDMEGKWGVTPDGNIMQGLAGASLKAMRGYITTTKSARLSLIIEDTTSGITTVMEAGDLNEQQAVYNLQGQKMQQAGKGLYIVNGKKMVRK